MKKFTKRILGLVLALAMIASYALVPSPMDHHAHAAAVDGGLTDYIQDGVTLHCWNWSIANIKANLGLIANMGYSSIQLSPMQELKEGTVNKPYENWWAVYQPISFNINTSENHAIGTKDELIELCEEAHKYDIKVIMDVVCNHTANNGNNVLCPLVDPDLLNNPDCWHDYSTNSWDYSSRYNITQYCMDGLPDLNTGNQIVQDKALAMLKEYIDCGVDGFRFDAAKQIETPSDDSSFASDFWPTVINGASDYAASTRNIMLYNYGELLENPDNSNSLPISAYTQYMSVTESVWSNDVRYKLEANSAASLQKAYFKAANADKLVLWAESHDTLGDGSSVYSTQDTLNKAWSLVGSRAYTMALFFPRANDMLYQEMGELAKVSWTSDLTKAVNKFHNHFAGQSEYLTQDTTANLYYNERGNSGVIITNFGGGSRDINLPVYAMASGTYYDQITGNQFTVNGGRIYGTMGDSGVAVVYNPGSVSCSHSSHGTDGYCYDCYAYVGHKSGTTYSTCGTASTRTIYFKNTEGWSTPYVYGWHDSSSDAVTSGWPGTKMTLVEGNIYKATIPVSATNVIFNNNSAQTANITVSAEADTYNYDTGFWSNQGEVISADNYYLFYTTTDGAYNGYDHRFEDNKLTNTFAEDSYVWIVDSNGVQYMTDGWAGFVNTATMKTLENISGTADKLYVPAGQTFTFTMTPNADGTITLSYAAGSDTGDSGNTGGDTTCTHESHTTAGVCSSCGAKVSHSYVNGTCSCGLTQSTGSDTMTIYFQNNWMWSDINLHYWGGASGETTWPGIAMEKYGNDGNYDIYVAEVPTDITGLIINGIKDDGTGTRDQSPDIKSGWYDGICYYMTWNEGNATGSEDISVMLPSETECAHSYTSKVTTAATCTTAGVKTYTCSKCGDSYTEAIAALGHSYVSGKCSVCGAADPSGSESDKTTMKIYFQNNWLWSDINLYYWGSAAGDPTWPGTAMKKYGNDGTYDIYVAEIPTDITGLIINGIKDDGTGTRDQSPDIKSGWYDGICYYMTWNEKNDVGFEDISVMLPSEECSHSYSSKVTTAAGCTTEGVRTYTCSKCGDSYTESIAATGHSYQ